MTVTARAHRTPATRFVGCDRRAGAFRLPVRVGDYRVSAELSGFATVARTISLLVGQTACVNLQMSTAALEESVTVSGQAPLVDATTSSVGKAIDSRQVSDLPVNGRNWVDLAMLAPGSRLNASTDEPGTLVGTVGVGTFQLNVDGLRVTQNQTSGFGQPKYSKDAIAEFEFVSSRFDATQGGSMGVQVNAITKSGTNNLSGSFCVVLPRRLARREGLRSGPRAAVLRSAVQLDARRTDPPATACTSSSTTSTSGSRRPSRTRARIRASTSIRSTRSRRRRAACGWIFQFSPKNAAERARQRLRALGTLRRALHRRRLQASLVGDSRARDTATTSASR